ncbi:MAG: hypothetical protein ACLT33_10875 [Lachnospira pectinoschiza]
MILPYRDYGNIFTLIGSGFVAVVRIVLKFLRLIREKKKSHDA